MDFNNDGIMDLLLGTENGYVALYTGSDNGDSVPLLHSEGYLKSYGNLIVHMQSSPCLYDYNIDGTDDLLVGAGDGQIYVYPNTGTPENYSYNSPCIMFEVETGEVDMGGNAVLQIVDLDGDSRLDLIAAYYNSSYDSRVAFFQGTEPGSPFCFSPPVDLYSDWGESIMTYDNFRIYPFAGDMNSDGSVELISGEYNGDVFYFPGVPGSGFEESFNSAVSSELFTVLSNPVKQSVLQLQVQTAGTSVLSVFDCSGRQISRRTVNPGSVSIDMQNLPGGIYTVVLDSKEGVSSSRITILE